MVVPERDRQELPGSKSSGEHHHVDLGVPGPVAGFPVPLIRPELYDCICKRRITHESFRPPFQRSAPEDLRAVPDLPCNTRKADRKTEFAEGKAVLHGVAEAATSRKCRKAGKSGVEDGTQQVDASSLAPIHRLRYPPGVKEEVADPARPLVVGAVPAEYMVHLADEAEGEVAVSLFLRPAPENQ